MGRPGKHKDAIVSAAVELFRDRGYAHTGIADILQRSGAPKGSLYHHFPGGKEQLGAEAVRSAGQVVTDTLRALVEQSGGGPDFLNAYFDLLALWVEQSDFRAGCPIATILLEVAGDSAAIREAGADALITWAMLIDEAMGCDDDTFGSIAVSAVEGAFLQSRVLRSTEPIAVARDALLRLYEAQSM
ncbi:MAG: TetR/AcrR family transcriptional regulator [Pseudomonadota bacterium]